jgi:hypothetical protein
VAQRAGVIRAFWWILMEDLRRPGRWLKRRRMIRKSGAPRRVAHGLAERVGRMMIIERRRVLAPRAHLVLHSWKKVHVPFSILLLILAAVHIWQAWAFAL